MTIKYVSPSLSGSGWLETCPRKEIYPRGSMYNVSLPSYLQVDVTSTKDGRDYFTILEGPHRGSTGNIRSLIDGSPTLIDSSHDDEKDVFVDFFSSSITDGKISGALWLGARPTIPTVPDSPRATQEDLVKFALDNQAYVTAVANAFKVVTDVSSMPPLGWSPLEIPDSPHRGGNHYLSASPYATVWFRVSYEGDKYLHCGQGTLGCVTVRPPEQWTAIYNDLIRRRRKKDNRSVGAIHIRQV